MSSSLNSLKGGCIGDYVWDHYNTRSLDYSSYVELVAEDTLKEAITVETSPDYLQCDKRLSRMHPVDRNKGRE